MGRDWDDMTEPEATGEMVEKFMEEDEVSEDKLETHLEFGWSSGGSKNLINDVKDDIENRKNNFIAGGCMPEGDKEIKCKFNLGTVSGVGGSAKMGKERPKMTFKDAILGIEDADQTRSPNGKFGEVPSGMAIVSDNDFIFCKSNGDKLVCNRFEKPEGVMNLKKMVDGGVLSGKNKVKDLNSKESVETESIKFPVGGEVLADKKKDLVSVRM